MRTPPFIFGGSYFNIIRAIAFTICLKVVFEGKILIKLAVISLVALSVNVGKRADTFKSVNIYFDF
ncbi:uncharacterized protein EV154DRAFT_535195 [Mucor mucedo]|uniref:uncharacterized protein n=1 Tax=Mucor mucedo TaxID=29922 RepID=UPI002220AE99|nr:uncharacterized protein EV154DRAFT_535195 [Mucor mucedo]KAI7862715.1 hypothetical protein EV154DRAFT_535195 [Mucor mucedo]